MILFFIFFANVLIEFRVLESFILGFSILILYCIVFEDRLKAVLKEVTDSDGQIVLFIDEIHINTIVYEF